MKTETRSRILLTVLIATPMAASLYWLFGGYPLYGSILLLGSLALLLWLWKPWKRFARDS